jgi:hypothetical protein
LARAAWLEPHAAVRSTSDTGSTRARSARELARVAQVEQAPVRNATRIQRRGSCSRRAGAQYLKSLRLLRNAALGLERARTKKALVAAANILGASDRLESSAVKTARKCWEALQQ